MGPQGNHGYKAWAILSNSSDSSLKYAAFFILLVNLQLKDMIVNFSLHPNSWRVKNNSDIMETKSDDLM